MNIFLIILLAVCFLALIFFVVKNLIIRAPIPTSRSDDNDEDLYFQIIDSLSDKHRIMQIFFNCKNLANKDIFSVSDPQVEVYERLDNSEPWKKVGETEIITDDLNPYFTKGVVLNYFINKDRQLKFLVKDIDIHIKKNTITYDLIGEYTCTLNDLISAGKEGLTSNLVAPKGAITGEISIIGELMTDFDSSREGRKRVVHFNEVSVKGLPLGLPTFFQIFRFSGTKKILAFQSEVQQSSFNPKWKSFNIHRRTLEEPLLIVLSKWNGTAYGGSTIIGEAQTTLANITSSNNSTIDIPNNKGQVVATLRIQYCKIEDKPINDFMAVTRYGNYTRYLNRFTFQEYYNYGLEIQTICALDMTTGSSDFHQKSSGPLFELILKNILSIIEPIDRDRAYSLYGFGAKSLDTKIQTQSYFPLNGSLEDPAPQGIQAVIDCYRKNYPRFQPSSVTDSPNVANPEKPYKKNDFYPIIKMVLDQADESRAEGSLTRKYYIIFILISGDDIDLEETKKNVIAASDYPISIVLIAVGKGQDFPKSSLLDADDVPLEIKGAKSKRDIVQFVNIDPVIFKDQPNSRDYLEREILAEVPAQVGSFMSMNFITPRNI